MCGSNVVIIVIFTNAASPVFKSHTSLLAKYNHKIKIVHNCDQYDFIIESSPVIFIAIHAVLVKVGPCLSSVYCYPQTYLFLLHSSVGAHSPGIRTLFIVNMHVAMVPCNKNRRPYSQIRNKIKRTQLHTGIFFLIRKLGLNFSSNPRKETQIPHHVVLLFFNIVSLVI